MISDEDIEWEKSEIFHLSLKKLYCAIGVSHKWFTYIYIYSILTHRYNDL